MGMTAIVPLALLFCTQIALGASTGVTKKCHALALSGGGDKGAYEAGVVYGLANYLAAEDRSWDVVTGISAGTLNTVAISLYSVGDELNMADFLVDTATNLTASDIFKQWLPFGITQGVIFETGIFNAKPEGDFLTNIVKPGFKNRKFVVGATSLTTGMLRTWNETSSVDEIVTAARASSAIPGVFDVITLGDESFVDGGVKLDVNVFDAVVRCLEIVDDPKDIVVDVVLCSGENIQPVDADKDHTLTVLMRSFEILRYNNAMDDVNDAKKAYPTVDWRYTIFPSQKLPGKTDLDFKTADLEEMVKIGKQDALNAIKARAAAQKE